jgi:phosphoglycolate phosphatase-like HAD superfamily hydrolase
LDKFKTGREKAMNSKWDRQRIFVAVALLFALLSEAAAQVADPLPSWKDTANKRAILEFVANVTREDTAFVPSAKRIAVFDNDGTLWPEQPLYFQLAFALDRVKALAPKHPEWEAKEPFASLLKGDFKAALAGGEAAILQIVVAMHAEMTSEEFAEIVRNWLATARHPKFQRPYTHLAYQPMLELVAHLRANGVKTYLVSGGGIEFMRVFSENVYGIPSEQVIGKLRLELRDGKPILLHLPEMGFIDDNAGKPVGLRMHIRRRPILAFGNSDGDFQMIEWTTTSPGARLGLLIHHDDAEREYAYDRQSSIGRLSRGLDEAAKRGWLVVSMKNDWKRVFGFEK